MNEGLIHLYHGKGKGKTTAAMGLCLRALGSGKKVAVIQFLKDGSSSELKVLKALPNVEVETASKTVFSFAMTEKDREKATNDCAELFEKARQIALNGAQVLLLDEICAAVKKGFLDSAVVEDFLKTKPKKLEIILTGREPLDFMLEAADYITEMLCQKHPYEKGIKAREGIEY
ncbi:MAG: cob(I)yrinic acid a,c-diamide adenosyltransferase [Clostridiales bacterium]|nr:cob(I)yrinic acid a,c-diamide adenosyltransferase [Clostridiales bacterium]